MVRSTSTPSAGTSPENRRISNRRKNLDRVWSSAEWKANKLKFLEKHPTCQMCGKKSELAHHPYIESYKGMYTDLELSRCVPYCKRCHYAVHRGLKLCPMCGVRYCRWDNDLCRDCWEREHPEIKEQREAAKQKWKRIRREQNQKFRKKIRETLSREASRTTQRAQCAKSRHGRCGRLAYE